MENVTVGIDLGTTNSSIAYFSKELGKAIVYKNSLGKEITPSVLLFEDNEIQYGEVAKNEQKNGNINTVAFFKSFMGDENFEAYLDGKDYSAEQLSQIFIERLVDDIQKSNNIKIENAVITVPAYFNEKQRNATLNAGKNAGLNVLKIINEPTAAIIAYGLTSGNDKNVLVYDLGGGTFDITVAHVRGTQIDVLATNGNHKLGGRDWDIALNKIVCEEFYNEFSIDINNIMEIQKELEVKCEELKKQLTTCNSAIIFISYDGCSGKYQISRTMFEERTKALLEQTMMLINNSFNEISEKTNKPFGFNDIDEIVLVGGSTRMPQIKDAIVSRLGKAPIECGINVDTIVSVGAAMQAELCLNNVLTLKHKSQINNENTQDRQYVSLVIKNNDISDITSHSLGMLAKSYDQQQYINSIIIPKNSKINCNYSKKYKYQGEKFEVYVLQGETKEPEYCDIIGKYIISGMDQSIENQITVDYVYDLNGVVQVSASLDHGDKLSIEKVKCDQTIEDIIVQLKKEEKERVVSSKVEIMLLIDTSGSMCGEPINKAKMAAKNFVNQLKGDNIYFSIVVFAESSHVINKFSENISVVLDAITKIGAYDVGGGTSETPMKNNYKLFSANSTKIIVVLTDGEWSNQNEEIQVAKYLKQNNYIIYAIGFGSADNSFLNEIASYAGVKSISLDKLEYAFKEVASSIATEMKSNSLR